LSNRATSAIEHGVRPIARCLGVAITICAWIAISNHCALAAIGTKSHSTHSCCASPSKPAKPEPKSIQCCKILRAISNASPKNLAPAIVDLSPLDLSFTELVAFAPLKISFLPAILDTGPPGKTSFVELIGNVRAHAPPFSA
jgi:hypothetical protein